MGIDDLAETIERTRYELMLRSRWDDLRDGEKEARLELGRHVLEDSGVAATLARLTEEVAHVAALEAALAAREDELADRRAQHEIALAERDGRIARLEEALARQEAATAAALDRADAVVRELADVRALMAGAEPRPVAVAPRRFGRARLTRPATA